MNEAMRTLVALALAVGAGVTPAQAAVGEEAPIEELARAYRSGLHDEAVSAGTLWSDERIALEIRRLIAEDASREKADERAVVVTPNLDVVGLERHAAREKAEERERRRLAAAAVLAESALNRLHAGDRRLLAPGLSTASLLLEAAPLGARGRPFAQRFYLLAALILHWHVEIAAGYGLLAKAIQRFPDDAELHTALASMIETVASLRTYEAPHGSSEGVARNSSSYTSEGSGYGGTLPGATLVQAEGHYEQALASDPRLDEARLRLAHVRLLMGRTQDALRDLDRVAAEAVQSRQRYLAWLFAGYGRERQGDVAGAAAAYRACLAHEPRTQTALLALGRSLDQLGDKAGAQEAFFGASAHDAPFDPWWSYGAGQPERFDDLVAQLRELVK
jgi:hypothetical protein